MPVHSEPWSRNDCAVIGDVSQVPHFAKLIATYTAATAALGSAIATATRAEGSRDSRARVTSVHARYPASAGPATAAGTRTSSTHADESTPAASHTTRPVRRHA